MRDLMSNDQHPHHPMHRRSRWWRSWLSLLPQELTSRKFNLYRSMLRAKLIARDRLREMFTLIKPHLIRYPAIDPASFETAVLEFCDANP